MHNYTATGAIASNQDEAGLNVALSSDATGRRNAITDRLGGTTALAFHAASGRVSTLTNPDATTIQFTYTPRVVSGVTYHDLTGVTHADTTTDTFVYDAAGNLTSHTDRAGNAGVPRRRPHAALGQVS